MISMLARALRALSCRGRAADVCRQYEALALGGNIVTYALQ